MPPVDDAARAKALMASKPSVPEVLISAREARATTLRDWLRAAWHVLSGARVPRRAPARRA